MGGKAAVVERPTSVQSAENGAVAVGRSAVGRTERLEAAAALRPVAHLKVQAGQGGAGQGKLKAAGADKYNTYPLSARFNHQLVKPLAAETSGRSLASEPSSARSSCSVANVMKAAGGAGAAGAAGGLPALRSPGHGGGGARAKASNMSVSTVSIIASNLVKGAVKGARHLERTKGGKGGRVDRMLILPATSSTRVSTSPLAVNDII